MKLGVQIDSIKKGLWLPLVVGEDKEVDRKNLAELPGLAKVGREVRRVTRLLEPITDRAPVG